MALLPV